MNLHEESAMIRWAEETPGLHIDMNQTRDGGRWFVRTYTAEHGWEVIGVGRTYDAAIKLAWENVGRKSYVPQETLQCPRLE